MGPAITLYRMLWCVIGFITGHDYITTTLLFPLEIGNEGWWRREQKNEQLRRYCLVCRTQTQVLWLWSYDSVQQCIIKERARGENGCMVGHGAWQQQLMTHWRQNLDLLWQHGWRHHACAAHKGQGVKGFTPLCPTWACLMDGDGLLCFSSLDSIRGVREWGETRGSDGDGMNLVVIEEHQAGDLVFA